MKFTFEKIPATIEEFKALVNDDLTDPYRTVALLPVALQMFTQDAEASIAALNILKGPEPMNNYNISFMHDRLDDKAYLPLSYFEGATPENDYQPTSLTIEVLDDPNPQNEKGYQRLFVRSGGADSIRPVKVRSKGDEWFIWEYSSIVSGIRIPASQNAWA